MKWFTFLPDFLSFEFPSFLGYWFANLGGIDILNGRPQISLHSCSRDKLKLICVLAVIKVEDNLQFNHGDLNLVYIGWLVTSVSFYLTMLATTSYAKRRRPNGMVNLTMI